MKKLNDYIAEYKKQLSQGYIQQAYVGLMKYMMSLKAHFVKNLSDKYSVGNISPGYMDFSYFPFFNDFLRERKLRFGIVLNHEKLRFELWLMGQNASVQHTYWSILKKSEWNKHQTTMPEYSVLEAVLVESPDFDKPDVLTQDIECEALRLSIEITDYLKNKN